MSALDRDWTEPKCFRADGLKQAQLFQFVVVMILNSDPDLSAEGKSPKLLASLLGHKHSPSGHTTIRRPSALLLLTTRTTHLAKDQIEIHFTLILARTSHFFTPQSAESHAERWRQRKCAFIRGLKLSAAISISSTQEHISFLNRCQPTTHQRIKSPAAYLESFYIQRCGAVHDSEESGAKSALKSVT
ncbi:hypothetical protein WMY93_005692 [Mugilogobius chulae]|uniref:Uncharacterized protein n=1 Tax=Mugilogobius chulae TaxID=88201 RepID=A0AAW0PRE8_9GOBI